MEPNATAQLDAYLVALRLILANARAAGIRPAVLVERLAIENLVNPAAPLITDIEGRTRSAPQR